LPLASNFSREAQALTETGVLLIRPRKPRDKAKIVAGVSFAQTYILDRLRRHLPNTGDRNFP
jgi:hypothetical protein